MAEQTLAADPELVRAFAAYDEARAAVARFHEEDEDAIGSNRYLDAEEARDNAADDLIERVRGLFAGELVDVQSRELEDAGHVEVAVQLPAQVWRPVGDEPDDDDADAGDTRSFLLSTLIVNGLHLHLEAHEVVPDSDPQECRQLGEERLNGLWQFAEWDGHFDTMELDGREYLVVATPFS